MRAQRCQSADGLGTRATELSDDTVIVCKPDMVHILNRAHGLHFFCVHVMPGFDWHYGFQLFIENTE